MKTIAINSDDKRARMTMTVEGLRSEYIGAWQAFATSLAQLTSNIGVAVESQSNSSLHDLVKALHWIPYVEARPILASPSVDTPPENIGAVTGLFFEQIVCAVLVPFFRKHCPGARIERNRCSDASVRMVARDPDLFISHGTRSAVFEIKVSPKKSDLEYVRQQRERHAAAGIGYFLVGGSVSLAGEALNEYARASWACFMSASQRNARYLSACSTLDVVAENARSHLALSS